MGEKRVLWKANNATAADVDIYVFENDAKFKAVKGTKGGRIYYLSFLSFDDKYFFWMQEPDQSKDADTVKSIQNIIDYNEEEEQKNKRN